MPAVKHLRLPDGRALRPDGTLVKAAHWDLEWADVPPAQRHRWQCAAEKAGVSLP